MFTGVTNSKLDGVVAFYPTSGAPSSDLAVLLQELLIDIPLKTSITIVGVVCKLPILLLFRVYQCSHGRTSISVDGLQANRSVLKMMCQEEEDGSIRYRMKNPVDPSR